MYKPESAWSFSGTLLLLFFFGYYDLAWFYGIFGCIMVLEEEEDPEGWALDREINLPEYLDKEELLFYRQDENRWLHQIIEDFLSLYSTEEAIDDVMNPIMKKIQKRDDLFQELLFKIFRSQKSKFAKVRHHLKDEFINIQPLYDFTFSVVENREGKIIKYIVPLMQENKIKKSQKINKQRLRDKVNLIKRKIRINLTKRSKKNKKYKKNENKKYKNKK